jgi:hypothetical protein
MANPAPVTPPVITPSPRIQPRRPAPESSLGNAPSDRAPSSVRRSQPPLQTPANLRGEAASVEPVCPSSQRVEPLGRTPRVAEQIAPFVLFSIPTENRPRWHRFAVSGIRIGW